MPVWKSQFIPKRGFSFFSTNFRKLNIIIIIPLFKLRSLISIQKYKYLRLVLKITLLNTNDN